MPRTIKQLAIEICMEMKLNPARRGFKLMIDAIEYAYNNRSCLDRAICKELYPHLAKRYGGDLKTVEKAMRDCIKYSKLDTTNSRFINGAVLFIDYHLENEAERKNFEEFLTV